MELFLIIIGILVAYYLIVTPLASAWGKKHRDGDES